MLKILWLCCLWTECTYVSVGGIIFIWCVSWDIEPSYTSTVLYNTAAMISNNSWALVCNNRGMVVCWCVVFFQAYGVSTIVSTAADPWDCLHYWLMFHWRYVCCLHFKLVFSVIRSVCWHLCIYIVKHHCTCFVAGAIEIPLIDWLIDWLIVCLCVCIVEWNQSAARL